MKTMTCRQLAGACDQKFQAGTFDEIAEISRTHVMEMAEKGDQGHIEKIDEMRAMMENPDEMNEWFEAKKKEFDSMPEDM